LIYIRVGISRYIPVHCIPLPIVETGFNSCIPNEVRHTPFSVKSLANIQLLLNLGSVPSTMVNTTTTPTTTASTSTAGPTKSSSGPATTTTPTAGVIPTIVAAPFSCQKSFTSLWKELPPAEKDDSFDLTKVQIARPNGVKLLSATAGNPIPPIIQTIPYTDADNNPATAVFKIESSPKWFTHISSNYDALGNLTISMGVVSGVKTEKNRVARIASSCNMSNSTMGGGQSTEYYFQIS
jgi:hypothetical protein